MTADTKQRQIESLQLKLTRAQEVVADLLVHIDRAAELAAEGRRLEMPDQLKKRAQREVYNTKPTVE